jgi:hypothetical protein
MRGFVKKLQIVGIQVQTDNGISSTVSSMVIFVRSDEGTHPSDNPGRLCFIDEILNLISRPHYSVMRLHQYLLSGGPDSFVAIRLG